jgi:DNA-binding response OmpR family regulator
MCNVQKLLWPSFVSIALFVLAMPETEDSVMGLFCHVSEYVTTIVDFAGDELMARWRAHGSPSRGADDLQGELPDVRERVRKEVVRSLPNLGEALAQ